MTRDCQARVFTGLGAAAELHLGRLASSCRVDLAVVRPLRIERLLLREPILTATITPEQIDWVAPVLTLHL